MLKTKDIVLLYPKVRIAGKKHGIKEITKNIKINAVLLDEKLLRKQEPSTKKEE